MRFTGERVIPHRYELRPMLREHLARYQFALLHVQGQDVIDLGCGCGYGSHLLATKGARKVVGIDIDSESIEYSRARFRADNLFFEKMDATNLNYPDSHFTAATCLEVFEHVEDHEALLNEAIRILAPGGTLILSTPNRELWSPESEKPENPWHVREFEREEFGRLLEERLEKVDYWAQTTDAPVPFILANLRLQGYYTSNQTRTARLAEWLHGTAMKVVMLPSLLISRGVKVNHHNLVSPERDVPDQKRHFFVAVGRIPDSGFQEKAASLRGGQRGRLDEERNSQ